MQSIFIVNLNLSEDYKSFVDDLVKVTIILMSVHVLLYLSRASSTPSTSTGLFNLHFMKLLAFAAIGVAAYYLVFNKLIQFRYADEDREFGSAPYSFSVGAPNILNKFRTWLKERL